MRYLIALLPIIGLVLLQAQYTSADLNDEVSIKSNTVKATTLSVEIQNTVDNSNLPYLFDTRRFQNDSLEAATLRIRNTGKVKTKAYMVVSENSQDSQCQGLALKIMKDDTILYSDRLSNLKFEMSEIEPSEKVDFVMLLSLDKVSAKTSTRCEYKVKITTKLDQKSDNGFSDSKLVDSKIEIEQQ